MSIVTVSHDDHFAYAGISQFEGSDRGRVTSKTAHNPSESCCAGLWAQCWCSWLGCVRGVLAGEHRRFSAGFLKVVQGPRSVELDVADYDSRHADTFARFALISTSVTESPLVKALNGESCFRC